MRWTLFFLGILLLASIPDAHALSCGNKIVELGDRKVEVLLKCGNPDFIEKWEERTLAYRDFEGRVVQGSAGKYYTEEWTYNFGSNRFLYFLKFVNEKLSNIEEGNRGGSLPQTVNPDCGRRVEMGDRRINVLMKCGPPTLTEERYEERLHSILADQDRIFEERQSYTHIEDWTYNLGPNYFLVFIKLENGRVRKIETGGYGY